MKRTSAESQIKEAQLATEEGNQKLSGAIERLELAKIAERDAAAQFKMVEKVLEGVQAELDELRDLLTLTGEAHATGPWRIGSVRLDPLAIEARLRRIVPSVSVQEGPNHLYVVYSHEQLDEADFNRVHAEFQSLLDMDRT